MTFRLQKIFLEVFTNLNMIDFAVNFIDFSQISESLCDCFNFKNEIQSTSCFF